MVRERLKRYDLARPPHFLPNQLSHLLFSFLLPQHLGCKGTHKGCWESDQMRDVPDAMNPRLGTWLHSPPLILFQKLINLKDSLSGRVQLFIDLPLTSYTV